MTRLMMPCFSTGAKAALGGGPGAQGLQPVKAQIRPVLDGAREVVVVVPVTLQPVKTEVDVVHDHDVVPVWRANDVTVGEQVTSASVAVLVCVHSGTVVVVVVPVMLQPLTIDAEVLQVVDVRVLPTTVGEQVT